MICTIYCKKLVWVDHFAEALLF